jgi:hypothetical protein
MAKKMGDEIAGYMIVIAIILAPFIWLYNAVGAFWFWVIVIGVPVLFLVGWYKESQSSLPDANTRDYGIDMTKSNIRKAEKEFIEHTEKKRELDNDPWVRHLMEIEDAWKRGDYDWVRMQLQKIAYSMVGPTVTETDKQNFTEVMKDFAKEDPLYNEVMTRLLPMVQESPGMVQSQIYKGEPDHIKEQMRYVLYFAQELGHIQRVKKGNSYRLYPPRVVVEKNSDDADYRQRKIDCEAQRERIIQSVSTFPYLMLDVVDFDKAKPECCAMDGKALRYDDPFWQEHFPPCKKTCKCRVIQYSEKMLQKRGVAIVDTSAK